MTGADIVNHYHPLLTVPQSAFSAYLNIYIFAIYYPYPAIDKERL
jgi:hypothetical protein